MGRGGSKFTQKCGIITGFIGLGAYFITSLALIGMAVHVCNMENYCLNMNNNEQRINPDLKLQFDIGLEQITNSFSFPDNKWAQLLLLIMIMIKEEPMKIQHEYNNFNTIIQYLEQLSFQIKTIKHIQALVRFYNENIIVRSKEGLRLTLQLALHFKVGLTFDNKTRLWQEYFDIYSRYGGIDQWHKMIRLVAIASVKDACQNFEAFDFFESRSEIGDAILQSQILNKTKGNMRKLGFTLITMPVLNVDIPDSFQDAIRQTQVVKQQQQKYNYTKAIEEIKGNTTVKLELMDQEIKLSESKANSQAAAITSQAQADSIRDALGIEKQTISYVQGAFKKWEDNAFNMAMIWIRTLEKKILEGENVTILHNFPAYSQ